MDIEKMRYFRIVAQEEHMTRAAKKINITQPSLSSIIANMEAELGVKLFERVGRQIVLNKYGKVFYKGADVILNAYDSILSRLDSMKDENANDINIAVTGLNFPKRIIAAFAEEYPHLRIMMSLIRADEIESTLNHSDSGIVLSSIPGEADNIDSVKLYEEKMYLVVATDDELADRESISIKELRNHKFAVTPQNTAYRVRLNKIFKEAGIDPIISIEGYTEQIVQMVMERHAVSIFTESDAQMTIYSDKLKAIPLTDEFCQRAVYMLTRNDVPLSDNEQSFYDFAYYEKGMYAPGDYGQ